MRTASLFMALAAAAGLVNAADPSGETLLRRLMTDSRFMGIVSPCKTGGTNRENAAEWLRTSFHDAVSHDAAAGTGGIDGSIRFEVGYDENRGVQINSVVTQYLFYQPEGVSLADIIVLGAIVSVGSCGGPEIPFYIGRTDATQGAQEGIVSAPESTTESHIETFARMGMSKTDMISLVACGHTLGGVHANINAPLTTQAYHHFDDTHAAFDNHIAIGHMNDNNQNPMGQPYDASNPGTSSDSRAFASDGNVTIKSYADSAEAFMNGCNAAFSKMFNEAIPSSVTLRGPIEPFPVTASFRTSLRNGAMTLTTGSARLYDMVGQWKSFDVGFTNRDGSVGTDDILVVRDLDERSIGKPVEIRSFNTVGKSVNPATGISSIVLTVTMNDGSVYASGDEIIPIQDTILVDVGPAYTCKYSGDANNNANGLNVTMAVLGPYNTADKVEFVVRTDSGDKTVRASFRAARDAYYNLYNVFISHIDAMGLTAYSAQVTKADGTVAKDTRGDWTYYKTSTLSKCIAGAEVPAPAPVPSGGISRRNAAPRRRIVEEGCPRGFLLCGDRCAHTGSDLEHCGGCARAGGVDCTTLSDGAIACIEGKCVKTASDIEGY